GSGALSAGIKKLNKGAGDLETGSRQVAGGTHRTAPVLFRRRRVRPRRARAPRAGGPPRS
ncbi:hypothetical protein AB0I97_33560, partial [Streptomyces sp. NPDC049951]|uniref:hypothetical protein n=1 Tax=Streptomyces sp. NPDC049951 TaxID=3156660 RepID=UPI003416CC5A